MTFRSLLVLLFTFAVSFGVGADERLHELQSDWAVATYRLEGDRQEAMFEDLVERVDAAVEENPTDPDLLIWQGIIKSTWAGQRGGLGALGLVKAAKASLERAMELDDQAMNGSAYTSLGALYYQVPGWPIAFGDDKKARQLLQKAVSINPEGMDPNYFYGEFLFEEKQYDEARKRLEKALHAPARPGRDLADSGRKQEIRALLEKVNGHLDS